MHALRSLRNLLTGLGLAAFVAGLTPGVASALPLPGTKALRPLYAKAISFINVNRVYCGVNNIGEVCVDSAGRGTVQGGFWPRGTPDNYVFNSGMQVAGIIEGSKPSNPWGGDTTGGWFFDGAGGRQETEGVTPAYQAFNTADLASWPQDAYVPQGDFVADIYATPLQGLKSASQGDVHFLAWEGNPQFNRARLHPLGILVDYRLLAWNYPAGAQDVVFLVATVYNITSSNPADYAQHRPAIAAILAAQGQKFQAINDAAFGVTLPTGGYTISPMYIDFAADNDVGNENDNYNGGILPFAMGYTYDGLFGKGKAGWVFDPSIFAPPFFAGVGFIGMKYLKGPSGPGKIQLLTTFCNGNCGGTTGHSDPPSMISNFRTMAGQPNVAAGDGPCDIPGNPAVNHMCFMLFGVSGTDTRIMESSDSLSLAPGEGKTIVIAYIFAAPVAIPGFTPGVANTDPGNPIWSSSADSMFKYNGLNRVDSITGFVKYNGPLTDPDGSKHQPVQTDFSVVKNSLLGKALVAQAVFDAQFLQEFAPDAPDFFLIPGDKQVTILWKPSDTETIGDPYYQVVGSPTKTSGGQTIPNPLYDPNYRQFDVEGYRIYRGRSDTPSALQLLAQFDYAGTTFKDYTGTVYNGNCAPEIGVTTDCPKTFGTAITVPPGQAYTVFQAYNIGPQTTTIGADGAGSPLRFVDQTSGTRIPLLGGTTTLSQVVDTAAVSTGGLGPLADTGVPFIFVDKAGAVGCSICGVSNGIVYFYSVTAFDVNAPGHGPTSLESAKVTKQVTPQAPAGNFISSGSVKVVGPNGRNGLLTDNVMPTLDPTTGEFSKKFPPSNAFSVSLAAFVPQVLKAGDVTVLLDSIVLGTASNGFGGTETATTWMSVGSGGSSTVFSIPESYPDADVGDYTSTVTIPGVGVDSALSSIYGGGGGYAIPASATLHSTGGYYTGIMGRGCINSAGGFPLGSGTRPCAYNGPRWFIGDNETMANPNSDNPDNFNDGSLPVTFSNSGQLDGVTKIFRPIEYLNTTSSWRGYAGAMSPFIGDADYRVYWGSAGKVDSVIDLTHDTAVPFNPGIQSSWGILNGSAVPAAGSFDGRAALSFTDVACISTFKTQAALQGIIGCTAPAVSLSQTAVPGPIVICAASFGCNQTAAVEPNNGFLLYLKGHVFMIELAGGALPQAGTAWTMRDYTGAISGGSGTDGNFGPYIFTPSITRPFTAVGASYKFSVQTTNEAVAVTGDILSKVHTVPDPYYVTSAYDRGVGDKDIQFVNVPTGATVRIYTSSGVLIRVLQNTTSTFGGIVHWDVRNRTNQFVASGVYFYNVEADGVSHTGRMTIVNYASTAIQ